VVKQEDFNQLKVSVDALKAELSSKVVAAAVEAPLRAAIESLDEKIGLTKRIADVEERLQFWRNLFTCILILLPIVGVIGGLLGVKSYDDFKKRADELLKNQLSDVRSLGYGLALADKQPKFAIPYLLSSFDKNPNNEPLVASLLIATDSGDEWSTGRDVLERLKAHPISFTSPWTYNAMGLAAINTGLSEPADLSVAKKYLDQGLRYVGRDFDAEWYLRTNLWRYYLATRDIRNAECEAALAAQLKTPADAQSWSRASEWKWFEVYFGSDTSIPKTRVESMYKTFYKFTEGSETQVKAQRKGTAADASSRGC
jgi:hypothetical protein